MPADLFEADKPRKAPPGQPLADRLRPKNLDEGNKKQFAADLVDEQIDALTRGVMANSVACARCHDHKFDPISTADYYGLAGIFKSTRSMKNHKVVAMWNERPVGTEAELAASEAHRAEVSRLEEDLKVRTRHARADLKRETLERLADYLEAAARRNRSHRILASIPEIAAIGAAASFASSCTQPSASSYVGK